MSIERLIRTIGRAVGEAMAENGKFTVHFDNHNADKEREGWSSFDALPLEGGAPSRLKVALARNDRVRVATGEAFMVMVDGDDDSLRFRLDGDTLRIRRRRSGAPVRVGVTMPPPREIAVGGAGMVEAAALAPIATVRIGGSGMVEVANCACDLVEAKIGGSGRIVLAGRSEALELAIGGSGHFASPALEVEIAQIRIGGSGNAVLASDGAVDVRIGGSGNVTVHGTPQVSLKAGGSGRVRTVPRAAPGSAAA